MKINVLKLCADGKLEKLWISPSVLEIRRELGGAIDTIKLFSNVQTFIRRLPNDLEENVHVHGVRGDVIITGGHGSYLAELTLQQMSDLMRMFRKERVNSDNN